MSPSALPAPNLDAAGALRLLGALVTLVLGQLLLKVAMHAKPGRTRAKTVGLFAAAVTMMAAWFFIWMGLLGDHELSFIYPFEAVGSAALSVAAVVLLREKMTTRLAVGIALITAGVFLVSLT